MLQTWKFSTIQQVAETERRASNYFYVGSFFVIGVLEVILFLFAPKAGIIVMIGMTLGLTIAVGIKFFHARKVADELEASVAGDTSGWQSVSSLRQFRRRPRQ